MSFVLSVIDVMSAVPVVRSAVNTKMTIIVGIVMFVIEETQSVVIVIFVIIVVSIVLVGVQKQHQIMKKD